MNLSAAAHLDLLAEIDALAGQLQAWRQRLPVWQPTPYVQAAVDRLLARTDTMRVRFDAPLVVATLGGTGTGKSSLVNALVGAVVSTPGRQRPTTRKPVLVCRPDITPAMLGIDPETVELVLRGVPALRDLVLLDCPDPDTAENTNDPHSNTARLRELLPHCDVLLVAATQQKYRSARVIDELAAAAPGARIVFVQTHADTDDDVRADWREHLAGDYAMGEMFYVDSVAALADAQAGLSPRGEFGRLVEHLSRELSGSAAQRIRRANFLDLFDETLMGCQARIAAAAPVVKQLQHTINTERSRLAVKLAQQMREELLATRRSWETRLVGEVTSRWGLSPFALVLRGYHGLGGLLSGATLLRMRTPAQLALWGAMEGARRWRSQQEQREADDAGQRAVAFSWDDSELRTAAIIIEGYVHEAGIELPRSPAHDVTREANEAGNQFVARAAGELQAVVSRVALRQSGWFCRLWYEAWFSALLGLLLYRLGKNFFFDSWLAVELGFRTVAQPLLGVDFFLAAGVVLVLWTGLLVGLFTRRLRRGLNAEIGRLAERWRVEAPVGSLFVTIEQRVTAIRQAGDELQRLQAQTHAIRGRLATPGSQLGHRLSEPTATARL